MLQPLTLLIPQIDHKQAEKNIRDLICTMSVLVATSLWVSNRFGSMLVVVNAGANPA